MIKIKSFLLLLGAIVISSGTLIGQNINGVVNSYLRVTVIVSNSFTVDNLSGDINDFEPGSKVLIIQMKGADIDRSNGNTYGNILALNEAGNYEYAIVKAISGSGPFIITVYNTPKSYNPAAFVQIISVPQYEDITVSGELTALPWNRVQGTGGVLTMDVSGTLSLAANINVSGKGYAGGEVNPVSSGGGTDITNFVTTDNAISGQKGEGIAIYGAEGEFGMGPLGNGGGGGNSHNAGGGGGGNFSAGGLGGDSHLGSGGRGMGGKQIISASSDNKIFMGGGGGGGQENNGNASAGTAGGGIILIRANKIVSDCGAPTRSILSNGSHAANTTGNDGAGGGGAGGSILLDVNVFDLACNLDVLTNGGNGGNVTIAQKHAGGGGGGAGAIFLPNSAGNAFTIFGSSSGSAGLDCFGAGCTTSGSSGEICVGDACNGDETWPELPNSAPAAFEDDVLTSKNAPVTVEVLNNDQDADFDDVLTVTLISGPSNGTVSLVGSAFVYTPNTNFTGTDAFQYQVCDNGTPASCSIATANVSVNSITLTAIETSPLTYTEGQSSVAITSSTAINHVDNINLASATIQISSNYIASEDILYFTDANSITGVWDAATGKLSLTGSASIADYQAALRSVAYRNTNNNNPSNATRTATFIVNDGTSNSNIISRDITLIPLNDAPIVSGLESTALTFTEGDAAKTITASLVAMDVDNVNIANVLIKISSNYVNTEDVLGFTDANGITGSWDAGTGTLTLSGGAYLDYQAARDAITYRNTNNDNPSALIRKISFTISDGSVNSNTVTRDIEIIPVNDAPVLAAIEATALSFTEGDVAKAITATLTTSDVDNANLASAVIKITANYSDTEDVLAFTDGNGITGTWDAATGALTLTGNTTLGNYQTAIRSVTYQNTNNGNPSAATRTVSITTNDGSSSSNTTTRDIAIAAVNDAPVLAAIESTALSYTEEDAAKIITASLTTNDVDNVNLAGAVVKISTNYVGTEDVLAFTDANGITGSWNTTTGVLTLTGSATHAIYEAALRTVTYQNTNNNNPSASTRTVSITVSDGSIISNSLTRDIAIAPVNDAPVVGGIESTALVFTEGDPAKTITTSLVAMDVDNANIGSALIKISSNYVSTEDVLGFTDANGITGSWDATTGTLTLSGGAYVDYQAARDAVTYHNTNTNNPSALTRKVSFTISDGSVNSNTVTRDIKVVPVNDAPVLAAVESTALSFTEGDAAKAITAALTTSDVDNANLASAVIKITANYSDTEDVLAFTDANGITGSWDAVTGALTLTGNTTLANYQTAIRSITYQNTNNGNPSAAVRTLSITTNDGTSSSNILTRDIEITPVNDAPVLAAIESTALSFTEGDAAKAITATLTTSDVDNANLASALIKITANYLDTEDVLAFTDANGITGSWDATTGSLTLTGNATLANYQTAIRSITYQNTNNGNPSATTRTLSITTNDVNLNSNVLTRDIEITPVNDAPVLAAIEATALSFAEGDAAKAITATLTTSDVDNANLASAVVDITGNYLNTEDILAFTDANGITGSWDAATGALTLTGNTTLDNYQTAIRSITYQNTNNGNPSAATRTLSITTNDGSLNSNISTRDIEITPVDDAPILAAIESTALSFTEGDAAKVITATLTASDVDNANLASAVIEITANYQNTEDVLAFTDANGITGSWDAATGTLMLSGNTTLANYQTAIRSITYQNTNNGNPSALTRTVSITVNDGSLNSNTLTRDIEITPVNDAPALAAIETTVISFTEGDAAKAITTTLTSSDVDNINLASAVIKITANYQNTEDVLAFTDSNGITGSWDAATGALTLTGNTTLANYQTAIRSITYQNTNNGNPSALTRTVSITVNDGSLNSNISTRDIAITPVNDAPVLAAIEATVLSFTEGDAAKPITATLTDSDVDNSSLAGAVIKIINNYVDTEDVLAFTDANGITGSWDAATGSLTLTGATTLAHYQDALRSVTYQNINNDKPSISIRTISFTINDSNLSSNAIHREITVIPVNDAPVLSDDVAATGKNVAVVIDVLANDHDVEGDALIISASAVTPPVNGTLVLNADQTFTYTPNFNFFGSDSFEYEICDNGNPVECSKAIVAITVNYKNYSPVATIDLIDIKEDEPITIAVLINDSDPDLDEINVSLDLVTKPRFGKVELAENTYTYTPNPNYNGNDSFEYQICDNGTPSMCTTALADIFIEPVNDAPEPADDDYSNRDVIAEIKGNVLENDYDIEADMLSVDLITLNLPSQGELVMKEDGSFSYTPNPGFFGEDTFEYFACDNGNPALCTKATVTLIISSGVPKGFSPNGDATNDEWIISGLEEYPMNSVVVMNRYGDLVFEMKGYDNASRVWRGEANSGLKIGSNELPDGTYFYMINFGDGKSAEKGFVIIKR